MIYFKYWWEWIS